MHRRILALTLTLVLVFAVGGCGRFARRSATPTTEPEHVSVGADLDLSGLSPTTTAPTAGKTPDSTAAPQGEPPQSPNPVSVTTDGFTLVLEVGGGTVHKADQPFDLSLRITNVSGSDRYYETNQRTYFVMEAVEASGSWRDSDCAPGKASGQPASVIKAGQTITFTARYPGPPDRLDNSDACRRAPNTYVLVGGFVWCPDDAIFGDKCDPSASHTLSTESIVVRLT